MIDKTQGIVLRYHKYQETSIIVHIFTSGYGLASYMVNGIRSARSKRGIGYFQPFTLLDMVIYHKPGREVQRLSEFKILQPTANVQQDVRKGCIALFLSEILGKLLVHEREGDVSVLFDFLTDAILKLNAMTSQVENFHLHFLLKLLPVMGLGVDDADGLVESMGMEMVERDEELLAFISELIRHDFYQSIQASGSLRFRALQLVISYLEHHTVRFGEVKSLKVLRTVFH